MGGNRTRGSDIDVKRQFPALIFDTLDITDTTPLPNGRYVSAHRNEVKSCVVTCVVVGNAATTLDFGIVGDTDEFVTGGIVFPTTFTAGDQLDVLDQFTDPFLEAGEILNCEGDGVPASGSYEVTWMLEPAPPA